jgi:hypothetical protein
MLVKSNIYIPVILGVEFLHSTVMCFSPVAVCEILATCVSHLVLSALYVCVLTFRLDEDQCTRRNLQLFFGVKDPDYYEFESKQHAE